MTVRHFLRFTLALKQSYLVLQLVSAYCDDLFSGCPDPLFVVTRLLLVGVMLFEWFLFLLGATFSSAGCFSARSLVGVILLMQPFERHIACRFIFYCYLLLLSGIFGATFNAISFFLLQFVTTWLNFQCKKFQATHLPRGVTVRVIDSLYNLRWDH